MKTTHSKTVNWLRFLLIIAISLFPVINSFSIDTYYTLKGKIKDKVTLDPIVFANVNLRHTQIGTITNSEGEFILKVPSEIDKAEIEISHLGYKSLIIDNYTLVEKKREPILLEEQSLTLSEVMVSNLSPREIVQQAFYNINNNYLTIPENQTAFYRETFKKNGSYKGVTEAVIEAYKSPYHRELEQDRIRILKARKQLNIKKVDTLMVKLQGGPVTSYMLDFVKNPILLLNDISLKNYDFTTKNFNTIDNKTCYVIEFYPKLDLKEPLYTGKFFIETNSLAFVGAEFEISPDKLDEATQYMITKKPVSYKVSVASANYLVNYKFYDDKWYFSHVRSDIVFKVKKRRNLFSHKYTSQFEMAVTNHSSENVEKPKWKESYKVTDVLSDQVKNFEDKAFWGSYNVIKPDDTIENAIKRLNRKLAK